MHRFFSSLLVVVSMNTFRQPDWKGVVDALTAKHADMQVATLVSAPEITDCKAGILEHPHRYVAFVMTPEEARFKNILALSRMMRELDDDIYDDAIWGVVTGPTAADALRMVESDEPRRIDSALATTGVDEQLVPGPIVCFSDANPPGCWWIKDEKGDRADFQREGDLSQFFADAWDTYDPQFILTSSHASQFNLELPFSRGNVIPYGGRFRMCPDLTLIDYRTGQANGKVSEALASAQPLEEPKRDKIWLAAGNCLIADNLGDDNMLMTALGWGRVNQLVGYTTTSWAGIVGWGTLEQFARFRKPLNWAHYSAKQLLLRELEETVSNSQDFRPAIEISAGYGRVLTEAQEFRFKAPRKVDNPERLMGLLWDRDATVMYGDPAKYYALAPRKRPIKASKPGDKPLVVLFDDSRRGRKLVSAPSGMELEIHDDFAFILRWPELKSGWEQGLVIE